VFLPQALGDTVALKDVEELLAHIDADRSGYIDYTEFVAIMMSNWAAERATNKQQGAKQKAQKQHQARLLNLKVASASASL
jgi:EF hand